MFKHKKHEIWFAVETVKKNRDGKAFKFHPASTHLINCYIYDDYGRLVAAGASWCHVVDEFSLPRGRRLALHRALLGFHLTKKQRIKVWNKYLKKFRDE